MKTLLTGSSLLLAVALVLGCSDGVEKKMIKTKPSGQSPSGPTANDQNPHRGMPPEQVDQPRTGDASPPADSPADGSIRLGPKLSMTVPEGWQRKPPRVGMITYEFAVPAAEGDQAPGRMTVMAAGGTIEANIQRWYGQFTQPDGSKTAERASAEKKEIAGHTVHLVDISGTYHESMGGGPFAPGKVIERPGYRMLAAIVETPDAHYFIKFYGPEKTVSANADAFRKMVEGMTEK